MMAHLNRQDTLKITFDRNCARPKLFEIEDWLEQEFQLNFDDVVGIHISIVNSVAYVKMINAELCDKIVESCGGGKKFKYSDGNIRDVTITHAGFGIRTIRIFELPFEVPAEEINAVIAPYGRVISNVAERWSNARKFKVLNGVRQLKVDLTKHVPSYISVCGYRGIVMYDGQPRTCAACNSAGHVRAECLQRRVAQLPAGEAPRPAAMTVLTASYAAAARGDQNPPPSEGVTTDDREKHDTAEISVADELEMRTQQPTDVGTPALPPTQQVSTDVVNSVRALEGESFPTPGPSVTVPQNSDLTLLPMTPSRQGNSDTSGLRATLAGQLPRTEADSSKQQPGKPKRQTRKQTAEEIQELEKKLLRTKKLLKKDPSEIPDTTGVGRGDHVETKDDGQMDIDKPPTSIVDDQMEAEDLPLPPEGSGAAWGDDEERA